MFIFISLPIYSQKDIVKVRNQIEKHLKTSEENNANDENEVTAALKTFVAAINYNDPEQSKEGSEVEGATATQLTNGSEDSTTAVSS